MGTVLASAIVTDAALTLQDTGNVGWSQAELLGHLNAGQRAFCSVRHDLYTKTTNVTSVAGTRQSIPADGYQLGEVIRNMGADGLTPGAAVRRVNRRVLDMLDPNWHASSPQNAAAHYYSDERQPTSFYVYPPLNAGRRIEVVYFAVPPVLTLSDAISLDDIYVPALTDYVLFRAYMKDSGEGNLGRARAHFEAATALLQLDTASSAAMEQGSQQPQGQ